MLSTLRGTWPGALLLTSVCGAGLAQVLPPDIGTTIREIEQRRPAVPERRQPALQLDEPARPALQAAPNVRFRVERFRITGTTAFPPAELLSLLGDFKGGDRSLADLEQAAARITRFYRERGYLVARAYVPAQDIAAGEVEIAVLEGRFGGLELHNTSRLSDTLVRETLSQASSGAVIRQAPLERELLLLAELAGVSSSATLKPGAQVGTSDLRVDIAPTRTLSGAIEADNFGNRFTGRLRLGGSVAAANLAGRGDLLSVRGLVTEDTDLWYGRAAYQVPVSGNGLRLGAAFSRTYYTLGQQFSALDAGGDANIYSLFGVYPAIRSTRGNLNAQVSLDYLDLDDQVNAVRTFNRRWIRSFALGVNGDARDDFLGGAVNAASIAYVNGYLQFRDEAFYLIDQATTQSAGSFDKLVYSALRLQRVAEALELYLGIQGQFAGKNLDPSQKFLLGGPNGVRAYPQGEGVGDDGFLGTAELRYALPAWSWLTRPQIFAFFDGGTVRINQEPFRPGINRISQYGAGIGANLLFAGGFALRGSVAWRIGSEPVPGVSNASSQGWIQLVKFF